MDVFIYPEAESHLKPALRCKGALTAAEITKVGAAALATCALKGRPPGILRRLDQRVLPDSNSHGWQHLLKEAWGCSWLLGFQKS